MIFNISFCSAYGLGTPNAMYAAFRQAVTEDGTLSQFPGVDVGDVFDTWVQNPGAPVVTVSINYETGEITATQVNIIIPFIPTYVHIYSRNTCNPKK